MTTSLVHQLLTKARTIGGPSLTVNEVVDIIREESDEEAFGAVGLDDDQDLFESIWSSAKARWIWLGINLFTAFFCIPRDFCI